MNYRLLFYLFIATVMMVSSATAQTGEYWHKNDYYSVELDGEGDAFVMARMQLEGLENKNISALELEIPYSNAKIYKAVQRTGSMDRYREPQRNVEMINYSINSLSDSTAVTLELDEPLTSNSETEVVIVYKTMEVAKKTFRGYSANFKTIQDSDATVRNVGVDISVPKRMQEKGEGESSVKFKPSTMAMGSQGEISQNLDTIRRYSNSGEYEAKNLDPGESFEVKTLYGNNWFLLHMYEVLGALLVLILFGAALKRINLKRLKGLFKKKGRRPSSQMSDKVPFSFSRPLLTGAGTGILFLVALGVTRFSMGIVESFPYGDFRSLSKIGMLIINGVLVIGSLFGPSLYLGKRFNLKEGVLSVVTGLIFAILLLWLLGLFLTGSGGTLY